jgi:hypothetical protein
MKHLRNWLVNLFIFQLLVVFQFLSNAKEKKCLRIFLEEDEEPHGNIYEVRKRHLHFLLKDKLENKLIDLYSFTTENFFKKTEPEKINEMFWVDKFFFLRFFSFYRQEKMFR